jgi:hypothetical protein
VARPRKVEGADSRQAGPPSRVSGGVGGQGVDSLGRVRTDVEGGLGMHDAGPFDPPGAVPGPYPEHGPQKPALGCAGGGARRDEARRGAQALGQAAAAAGDALGEGLAARRAHEGRVAAVALGAVGGGSRRRTHHPRAGGGTGAGGGSEAVSVGEGGGVNDGIGARRARRRVVGVGRGMGREMICRRGDGAAVGFALMSVAATHWRWGEMGAIVACCCRSILLLY